ncbi:MAG: hypothetical protein KDK37_14585 [Leptospiraceae bacterium]|nr:hypothetical protein [Leptospiraceae bacterium]
MITAILPPLIERFPDFPEFAPRATKIKWACEKRIRLDRNRCRVSAMYRPDAAHLLVRNHPSPIYCAYDPEWITSLSRWHHSSPFNPDCFDRHKTIEARYDWCVRHRLHREAGMLKILITAEWQGNQ